MPCTVCQHPKRQEIDQALIAGSATLNTLSQEHGLSTSALHRHKAHLQANMGQARERLQNNLLQGCYFWLGQMLEMVMETAKSAQAEGNHKLVLQAASQGSRLIKIIQKQEFHMEDLIVYDILTSPQWSTQTGLLPDDPNIMAMNRQSLAGIFSTPCPDDPPPTTPSASPPGLDRPAIQAVAATPPQPKLKTENRKTKTVFSKSGKQVGNQREMTAMKWMKKSNID